jgi:sulfonate dioxygenase
LKNATVNPISAKLGAEVRGVQISQLDNKGKDELALFIAQKKVVAFRDQDFADLPIPEAMDYVRYFGRLHIHPTGGVPAGYPEVHLVHRGANDTFASKFFEQRINSVQWHSDLTFEEQPPATTFLYLLDGPEAGGDTLFADQVTAYKRLSPEFRKRLDGLYAVHSGKSPSSMASCSLIY